MDRNSPDFYIEETLTGCAEVETFVRYILSQSTVGSNFVKYVDEKSSGGEIFSESGRRGGFAYSPDHVSQILNGQKNADDTILNKIDTPLVMPVITPRFVPTCTSTMMQFLGDISLKYGLPVQSHLSESVNEIEWVKSLHPAQESYAEVYEMHNLLHSRAYMAHCCHSSEHEIEVLKRSGAGVVHCANSNFMLSSGIMDVRRFVTEDIPVALGTDVAGGYSPSILDAIRQTLIASQAKSFQHKAVDDTVEGSSMTTGYKPLNYREAFHIATMGGAKVLGMDKVVGNFRPGKKMDCLVVDVDAPGSPIDIFDGEGVSEKFQKFLFNGDDRNIETVIVDGKIVIENVKFVGLHSDC